MGVFTASVCLGLSWCVYAKVGVSCPQLVLNGLGVVSRVLHGNAECGTASLSVVWPH